jgi:Zn-dependent protease
LNIDPIAVAISFGVLLLSLTIHEAAHAWTADKLGDPTARALGRVSLNPLVHIDWIGTVLLPLIASGQPSPLIGWAKPVPVVLRNLRHPRRDFMLVAAAGRSATCCRRWSRRAAPAACGTRRRARDRPRARAVSSRADQPAARVLQPDPVPPLDGGNVMLGLLPPSLAATIRSCASTGSSSSTR